MIFSFHFSNFLQNVTFLSLRDFIIHLAENYGLSCIFYWNYWNSLRLTGFLDFLTYVLWFLDVWKDFRGSLQIFGYVYKDFGVVTPIIDTWSCNPISAFALYSLCVGPHSSGLQGVTMQILCKFCVSYLVVVALFILQGIIFPLHSRGPQIHRSAHALGNPFSYFSYSYLMIYNTKSFQYRIIQVKGTIL